MRLGDIIKNMSKLFIQMGLGVKCNVHSTWKNQWAKTKNKTQLFLVYVSLHMRFTFYGCNLSKLDVLMAQGHQQDTFIYAKLLVINAVRLFELDTNVRWIFKSKFSYAQCTWLVFNVSQAVINKTLNVLLMIDWVWPYNSCDIVA